MGIMINLARALVILPGGSSEESGEYRKACEAVGLRPSRHGHAIYLAGTAPGPVTLVSAELGEPGAIRCSGRVRTDRSGSRHSGEQHGGTTALRGIRTSTEDAEFVEIGLTGHPIARVAVRRGNSKLQGSVSSSPEAGASTRPEPGPAQPEGQIEANVRQALAGVLAETLLSALWPAAAAIGPLEDYDSLYQAAEILLEPEALLLMLINASVRAAAHTLGFGILAPLIGRLAEDLCAPLLRPSPEDQAASDTVKIIDIDLYLAGGQPAACPAIRELATETVAGVIGTLLKSRPSPQKGEIIDLRPSPDILPVPRSWAAPGQDLPKPATSRGPSHRPSGRSAEVSPSWSPDLRNLIDRIIARAATKNSDTQPSPRRVLGNKAEYQRIVSTHLQSAT